VLSLGRSVTMCSLLKIACAQAGPRLRICVTCQASAWPGVVKPRGDRLNIAQIKLLTGGGEISARHCMGISTPLPPSNKLLLITTTSRMLRPAIRPFGRVPFSSSSAFAMWTIRTHPTSARLIPRSVRPSSKNVVASWPGCAWLPGLATGRDFPSLHQSGWHG